MKKEMLEAKGKALLNNKTVEQLCEMWLITNDKQGEEIPTVRGWIMDKLEEMSEEAFNEWIFTKDVSLMDDPKHFFIKQGQ